MMADNKCNIEQIRRVTASLNWGIDATKAYQIEVALWSGLITLDQVKFDDGAGKDQG